jgi:hypothetical protein
MNSMMTVLVRTDSMGACLDADDVDTSRPSETFGTRGTHTRFGYHILALDFQQSRLLFSEALREREGVGMDVNNWMEV